MAISVDQRREDALRYVEDLGLTFPVLWDEGGQAARIYSASSIPVSFVIDPSGAVVGVSQGARDWSRLTSLVDGLIQAPESELDGYTVAQDRVGLPDDVVPPTATVRLPDTQLRVGRPFVVEVVVRWSGSFEDYVLHPPHIHLPEGVDQLRLSAQAGSEAGRRTVVYEAELQAQSPGAFALDPVEIRYTPIHAQESLSTRLEGPTITVRGGRSRAFLVTGLAGGAALAMALILGMAYRKRRLEGPAVPEQGWAGVKGRYDEARRKRLQGDVPGFLGDMEAICGALGLDGLDQDILEGVRYGGQMPPAELLDRLQRDVERELAERQEEPEHEARAGLKLAGERTANEKENRA
jgi:hypothetical protein